MSNLDTINLKEMADKATDKATNESKKPGYRPIKTGESEAQVKQEEEEKKITVEELFNLNDLFEKVKNEKDMNTIHQIGTIFQKTDAQHNTNNWFNNIPTASNQITKEQTAQLEGFLKKAYPTVNISINLFVQKFAEFNEQRRNDAVAGLKNITLDVAKFTVPKGEEQATYILNQLKDPNSDIAKTLIKQFSLDGYREYNDLLTKNPAIEAGWKDKIDFTLKTDKVNKALYLTDNNTILSNVTDKGIKKYNETSKDSQFTKIFDLLKTQSVQNPQLAKNDSFQKLVTNFSDGDLKDFQKIIYGKDESNPAIDGMLGPDTLRQTQEYISSLNATPKAVPNFETATTQLSAFDIQKNKVKFYSGVNIADYKTLFTAVASKGKAEQIQSAYAYMQALINGDQTLNGANTDNQPGILTFQKVCTDLGQTDIYTTVKTRIDKLAAEKRAKEIIQTRNTVNNVDYTFVDNLITGTLNVKYTSGTNFLGSLDLAFDASGKIKNVEIGGHKIDTKAAITKNDLYMYGIMPIQRIQEELRVGTLPDNKIYMAVTDDGRILKGTFNKETGVFISGTSYEANGLQKQIG